LTLYFICSPIGSGLIFFQSHHYNRSYSRKKKIAAELAKLGVQLHKENSILYILTWLEALWQASIVTYKCVISGINDRWE